MEEGKVLELGADKIISDMNTDERITVEELIKNLRDIKSESGKKRYLSQTLKVNTYTPYMMKVGIADTIVKNSCFDEKGNIRVDSPKQFLLYMVALVSTYTNIEIGKNGAEEYDLLNMSGVIDHIITRIPKNEIEQFKTVIKMKNSDVITNSYEIHSFIAKMLSDMWVGISPSVNNLLVMLENASKNIDTEKLAGLFEKYIGKK